MARSGQIRRRWERACGFAMFGLSVLGAHMRKTIIACFAIVVLTSPLHAESAGSAALKGGAKGAGAGGVPCNT